MNEQLFTIIANKQLMEIQFEDLTDSTETPKLKSSYLKNRWKKDLDDVDLESWIKLYNKIKELKVKYRFSLDESLEFFRNSSHKSNVNRFIFA